MDPFNISGVDKRGKSEQVNGGVDVTKVITYKISFVVNGKPVTVSLALGEVVTCNTIFLWLFLKTIKASIITEKNALISVLLGEQFRMEVMVP